MKTSRQESASLTAEYRQRIYTGLPLSAEAVYVLDTTTSEVLYQKQAHRQLPLASITKVMTALVAHESAHAGRVITITDTALEAEGDIGLFSGEKWRLEDLLHVVLLTSSNDGARALAEAFGGAGQASGNETPSFVDTMNETARRLGLSRTFFLNETGLDEHDEQVPGAYGSARDVAHLFAYALAEIPEYLGVTNMQAVERVSVSDVVHTATNTNKSVNTVPGLLASKTGYTDLAGGNLVTAVSVGLNRPIIFVVLGSTPEGRFSDMEQLVATTRDILS